MWMREAEREECTEKQIWSKNPSLFPVPESRLFPRPIVCLKPDNNTVKWAKFKNIGACKRCTGGKKKGKQKFEYQSQQQILTTYQRNRVKHIYLNQIKQIKQNETLH